MITPAYSGSPARASNTRRHAAFGLSENNAHTGALGFGGWIRTSVDGFRDRRPT